MGGGASLLKTARVDQLKPKAQSGSLSAMSSTPQPRKAVTPGEGRSSPDRVAPAWRAWLRALASDAEAALGAALAYETLDDTARGAFLDALEQDVPRLDVPRVAVFAPLLSVERDPARRERITLSMGDDIGTDEGLEARAWLGKAHDDDRVVVVETPVYLQFVRVTSCRFALDRGVRWVRHEPLLHIKDSAQARSRVDEVTLERVPLGAAIDAVANALVAQRRRDGSLPDTLHPLLELFDARIVDPTPSVLR